MCRIFSPLRLYINNHQNKLFFQLKRPKRPPREPLLHPYFFYVFSMFIDSCRRLVTTRCYFLWNRWSDCWSKTIVLIIEITRSVWKSFQQAVTLRWETLWNHNSHLHYFSWMIKIFTKSSFRTISHLFLSYTYIFRVFTQALKRVLHPRVVALWFLVMNCAHERKAPIS